jgi:hypothetical protein
MKFPPLIGFPWKPRSCRGSPSSSPRSMVSEAREHGTSWLWRRAVNGSGLVAQSIAWEQTRYRSSRKCVISAGGTVLRYGQFYVPCRSSRDRVGFFAITDGDPSHDRTGEIGRA